MDIYLVIEAHTAHTKTPDGAATYYNTISTRGRLARTSVYMVLTLISDAIIVRPTSVENAAP